MNFKKLFFILFYFVLLQNFNLNGMERTSLYEILEVNKNATPAEIKKAYFKLARQWHPDKWEDKAKEERDVAEEKFKEISSAYEILSDEQKRKHYDKFGGKAKEEGSSQEKANQLNEQLDALKNILDYQQQFVLLDVILNNLANIYDENLDNRALNATYDLANDYFRKQEYDKAYQLLQLGIDNAIYLHYPAQYDRFMQAYSYLEETAKRTPQRQFIPKPQKGEHYANIHLTDFKHANKDTPESKEYFLKQALDATEGIFISKELMQRFIEAFKELIQIYQKKIILKK